MTTLEDTGPIARRVFGSSHPVGVQIEISLQNARAVLRARGDVESLREAARRRLSGRARDPSAAADDAAPPAPAASADSSPDGSSGEAPAAAARDAEAPSSK